MGSLKHSTLRWGILGTARIARNKIIPALREAEACELIAIASRDQGRARAVASEFGIPHVHDDYASLLCDPDVDVIYNPLPNNLHVDWSEAAAQAGKHVLCEKPLGQSADDVRRLLSVARSSGRCIQEAFMVFGHPQWQTVAEIVGEGGLGEVRAVRGQFSFYNTDPSNIRNDPALGGGGLLDLSCYGVALSRWLFNREPDQATAVLDWDERFKVDRSGTICLDFGAAQVSFFYSLQSVYRQSLEIEGTKARLEIEVPFTPAPDHVCRLNLYDGSGMGVTKSKIIEVTPADQYARTTNAFAAAILEGSEQPLPLEHSLAHMRIIDTLFQAAEQRRWLAL